MSEGLVQAALFSQSDDGMTTFYNVDSNANYLQYNGIGRVGVRFDASASGLTKAMKSVRFRFRKYGSPTGNVVCGIRKASDDSLVTIGSFPIQSVGAQGTTGEITEYAFRLRSQAYQMVLNDLVTIEFPSNATDGLEIAVNTSVGNPTNYTGRSHNGSVYANTVNPPAIVIKGF